MIKKVSKILLIIIGVIVLLVAGFVLWLSINEFNPEPVSDVDIEANSRIGELSPYEGQEISLISWNIGYGGLGKNADFFMDGGEDVVTYDHDGVTANLVGIYKTLYDDDDAPSIFMLQEVDNDSARTYGICERQYLGIYNSAYAMNYSCPYVPFPLPPIGKVNSGLLTTSLFDIDHADRISLPCPFSWPVSAANLKRCLLVSYMPIEDSEKHLVIVNLHLEAYDDGEGKIAQTKQLREFIQSEYERATMSLPAATLIRYSPADLTNTPTSMPTSGSRASSPTILFPRAGRLHTIQRPRPAVCSIRHMTRTTRQAHSIMSLTVLSFHRMCSLTLSRPLMRALPTPTITPSSSM